MREHNSQDFLQTGPPDAPVRLLLAHGAGAPMSSPFLNQMAQLLGERAIAVTRFEFSYMAARREDGKKRPPPRAEFLVDDYRSALHAVRAMAGKGQTLFIGGKSLGGRVASLIADEAHAAGHIAGLVCLGYPFHPPGKPESLRTAHLEKLACPTLIVQGERDPFGNRTEVTGYALSAAISLAWMPDGDHDFGPRGASGFTRKGNLAAAADAAATFMLALSRFRTSPVE